MLKNLLAKKTQTILAQSQALENATTSMMLADAKNNIVYLNKSVIEFLKSAEKEIQKDLPHFDVSKLIGKNIDIFHKNPDHQKSMLSRLNSKYTTTITVGGRMFDLVATPLMSQGRRIGTSVEWGDAAMRLQNHDYVEQLKAISKLQAVIEFNMDGTIRDANENFLKTMGYEISEIVGKHHSIFVESAVRSSHDYQKFWQDLNAGRGFNGEFKRIGKHGKEVFIQGSYNPIAGPDGKPVKVVKFAVDVTDQAQRRIEGERVGSIMDQNLDKIVLSVENVNQQSATVASASEETAATVNSVASAAEELNASIREISQSMAASRTAVENAQAQTQAADSATQRLATSAAAMSGVAELIKQIAAQINLLALNATIESARAGEAGKGFAVVAGEVKNLARQVADATSNISDEISGIQSISDEVVSTLAGIKESVEIVHQSVTGAASAVEEQSVVTREISSNMTAASSAVESINVNMNEILKSVTVANDFARSGKEMYSEFRTKTG